MEQYVKYLRKSRFDRDYAELSIEETLKRHEAILDKMAIERGYFIAKTYHEVVSGESIAARPEIQKMLEEVSEGLYAGVLVVDLERLARGNSADQAYISQIFQFSGTKIITPMKVYDPLNEFDEEYFEFGLFMSRREYKTIVRRMVRGRESSAAEGKYVGSIAPYGYERVKIHDEKGYTLAVDPKEGPVVQKIFKMFVSGRGSKIICNYLNDHKIPTRHGELWNHDTILNMIRNPVYMGKIRHGWCKEIKSLENGTVKRRTKHCTNMDDYDVYDGLHPALVSEDVFMKAQEIVKGKIPAARVKDEFELKNPFAGLLFCSLCGKRIGRTTLAKPKCTPRFRCVNQRNCQNSSADFHVVEEKIIEALRDWVKGYKIKIDNQGYAEEIEDAKKQIAILENEKLSLEKQMENAFDLVEQGVYTAETFQARQKKIMGRIDDLEERREELIKRVEKLKEADSTKTRLIPQTEELLASYDSMTNEERNHLLKEILYEIRYFKKKGVEGEIVIDLYPKLPQYEPR